MRIAHRTLHFSRAQDGSVLEERRVNPIGGLDRTRVAETETALRPVAE